MKINNQEIEQINENKSIKFLGVHIDKKLTWKNHVHHINSKLSQINFVLNNIKKIVPKKCTKNSLLHPLPATSKLQYLSMGKRPENYTKKNNNTAKTGHTHNMPGKIQ